MQFKSVFVLASLYSICSTPVFATPTKCTMKFQLDSWSVFYKRGRGTGTIHCDNGQSSKVKIKADGGGISFGKSKITDGNASFSEVLDISDIFGGYATAEAHAGAGKSAQANVMTKGSVSMALAGKGSGVDIGFAFGSFIISKAGK